MSDDALSSKIKSTIEACLAEGYAPFRASTHGTRGSAVREAARRLGMPPSTVTSWADRMIGVPDRSGTEGAYPDANPELTKPASDPIDVRRLKDQLQATQALLSAAERRAAAAEDIRAGVLGLTQEPLKPRMAPSSEDPHSHGRQTVVLHLSDIHAGETIRSSEILGSNKYNMAICHARLGRLFRRAAALCNDHWPQGDKAPVEIVICLGGDLISGSIHPELAETNEGTDYEIFLDVAEHIAGGIAHLRERTALPMRVFSVPGNHGRQTLKPQTKRQGLQSWDILVADFAEAALRSDNQIQWFRSEGTDCYFDVLGWPILLTHGHAMGSGGGQGFIGPAAPIIRGHQKVSHTELRQRRPVYLILSGHYHTTTKTPWGWSNGSLVGYNEFVRAHRGEPEAAQQSLFVIHERKGLIRWQPIYVGDPSEGSLYQGFQGWQRPMYAEAA